MGMYTQLKLDVELKSSTPDPIIEAIHIMCRTGGSENRVTLDDLILAHPEIAHPLFDTWRAVWQFRCDSAFGDWAPPSFTREGRRGPYRLRLSFSVKNYERSIQLFLDWVSPFLCRYLRGWSLGTYKYEEDREESRVVWNGRRLVIRASDD